MVRLTFTFVSRVRGLAMEAAGVLVSAVPRPKPFRTDIASLAQNALPFTFVLRVRGLAMDAGVMFGMIPRPKPFWTYSASLAQNALHFTFVLRVRGLAMEAAVLLFGMIPRPKPSDMALHRSRFPLFWAWFRLVVPLQHSDFGPSKFARFLFSWMPCSGRTLGMYFLILLSHALCLVYHTRLWR